MARAFSIRRQPGFTTIAVACFVALYAPILILVFYSFNAGDLARRLRGLLAALVRGGLEQRGRHRGVDPLASDRIRRGRARHDCRDNGGDSPRPGPRPIAG